MGLRKEMNCSTYTYAAKILCNVHNVVYDVDTS